MTKSILRTKDGILIEIRKHGIDSIYYNGKIRIGEYDGVEFIKKDVSEEKLKFAEKLVAEVNRFLSICPEVISFVFSDMIYIKFKYENEEIVAFISEDNSVTFDKPYVGNNIRDRLLYCKEEALKILTLRS